MPSLRFDRILAMSSVTPLSPSRERATEARPRKKFPDDKIFVSKRVWGRRDTAAEGGRVNHVVVEQRRFELGVFA